MNQKKKRRHRKKYIKIAVLLLIAVLAITALTVFGLFRVSELVISGNEHYTATEVQQAIMQDGLCQNTLYLLWKFQDKERTEEALPFLSGIEVRMVSPFKVEVQVYEKPEVAYIQAQGTYIYFDREGVVMQTSEQIYEDIPEVSGITVDEVTLYERLKVTDEEKFDDVVTLASVLNRENLIPDEIRYSTRDELIVIFGNLNVIMGDGTDLEGKVTALKSILPNIEEEKGIIYMEDYSEDSQTVTYRENAVLETEPATNADGEVVETEETTGTETGTEAASGTTESSQGPTYQESDGTFATDSEGNEYYMDKNGNITYNIDQYNYTDENGEIITDGYGYIDPYTGAYII